MVEAWISNDPLGSTAHQGLRLPTKCLTHCFFSTEVKDLLASLGLTYGQQNGPYSHWLSEPDYNYKSVAIQILQDAGLAPICLARDWACDLCVKDKDSASVPQQQIQSMYYP